MFTAQAARFAMFAALVAGVFTGVQAARAADQTATRPVFADYVLDFDTGTNRALQSALEQVDADLRGPLGMTDAHTAVGVLDLTRNRLALLRPDREEYAASVPKVGILLAYFDAHPGAADQLDPLVRRELGLMAKASSNEMAAKYSRLLGLKAIQQVLTEKYKLYDPARGGGIWVGKHYGKDAERYPSPVGQNSHAATVRQVMRYWLMLEQGKLVSPAASRAMREIFASPDIPHDDIKFVRGLKDRPGVEIVRKWGTWQDWRHDSAIVTGPGRHYILVGLTHHPKGDTYLEQLARRIDDLMQPHPNAPDAR